MSAMINQQIKRISSLTLPTKPDLLLLALNLSPELINRLVALKSLLDLGDMELATIASSRLQRDREEPEIALILSTLKDHRYAEAASQIDKLLSDGTRLACWTDPEIALLEVELERVTAELADLETEQAEIEHQVSRFQAAHNDALGARIERLLKLRLQMLKRQIKSDPEQRPAYDQARRDFEDFQRDQEIQKESDAKTKWELSETEHAELKQLFRKGSKLCHPDLVPVEHHDAASEMFRQLRKTYGEGDLERVRKLVKRAAAGLFDASGETGDSNERTKDRLKARIAGIREVLERSRVKIQEMKRSTTYQTMTENADWLFLFEKQAELLDQEIDNLCETLKDMPDEDA